MKRFLPIMLLVATIITFGSMLVFAEDMGSGTMGKGQGMGGMSQHGMHGTDSMAMDKKMQELQQHEKMMEGIEDPKQMMTEMKKHMQMMGDMMGANCCKLGGMSGKPEATSGSGSMSEHK
jgi:hypothetical protein